MSWRDWLRRTPPTPAGQAYLDATPSRVPRKTPFEALTFLVLDAETTGFDVQRDRLLSLAAVPVSLRRIDLQRMRAWTIYQPVVPLNEAVAVHGILPGETATGETEADVLAEFLGLASGAILVGHHIGFDAAMIDQALRRHHHVRVRNLVVDTAVMARETIEAFRATAYPGQRPPSLEELCEHCGIVPTDRHTAAGDTFTTAELFLVFCARLQRLRGRTLVAGDLPLTRAR